MLQMQTIACMEAQTREESGMTDTCVCCGQTVPEGRMVCPECEIEVEEILDTFIEEV